MSDRPCHRCHVVGVICIIIVVIVGAPFLHPSPLPPPIVIFTPPFSSASLPPGVQARGRWRGSPLPFLWGTPLCSTGMANRCWCGILIHVKKGGERATDCPKNNRHNPYKTKFLCWPNFGGGELSCLFFCRLKKSWLKLGAIAPLLPLKKTVFGFFLGHAMPRYVKATCIYYHHGLWVSHSHPTFSSHCVDCKVGNLVLN